MSARLTAAITPGVVRKIRPVRPGAVGAVSGGRHLQQGPSVTAIFHFVEAFLHRLSCRSSIRGNHPKCHDVIITA